MHHNGPGTNFDPIWRRMEIGTLVKINAVSELDMVRKSQPDVIFDCGSAIHVQDKAVEKSTQCDPHNRWNPSEANQKELFIEITENGRCLAAQIEL
jgi:hypothetical protein